MWSHLRNTQSGAVVCMSARRAVATNTASSLSSTASTSTLTTSASTLSSLSSAVPSSSTAASYTSLASVTTSSNSLQSANSSSPSTSTHSKHQTSLLQAREIIERGLSTLSFSTLQPNNEKSPSSSSSSADSADLASIFALGPNDTTLPVVASPHAEFPNRVYTSEIGFLSHPRTHSACAGGVGLFRGAVL
jgi:hypothetical protein